MSTLHAIILGITQGLTEFIPVSSSGHLIVVREVFNIPNIDGLAFDAVLQLATVLAVGVYFFKDLVGAINNRVLLLAIVLGTIPAIIAGLFLENQMETVFRSANLVAWMLLVGALLMYLAEKYGKQDKEITPKRGLVIGIFQALALVPGISRSGATISGGLFSGLTRESAVRFSFLLSFPIILGSGVKKLLELREMGELAAIGPSIWIGSVFAFVTGLLAIKFLITYIRNHSLRVFIWYRVVIALVIFIFLA